MYAKMEFHETSSRMGTIKLLPIISRYQYRNTEHRNSLTLKIIYCKKYYFRRNSRKVLCKHCDNLLEISASKVCSLSQVLEILFRFLCNKTLQYLWLTIGKIPGKLKMDESFHWTVSRLILCYVGVIGFRLKSPPIHPGTSVISIWLNSTP